MLYSTFYYNVLIIIQRPRRLFIWHASAPMISELPLTLGTVYYLSRKEFSHDQTMLLLREFCVSIPCLGSAPNACSDALFMGMRDFEDALQVAMAKSECDMIITRNVSDFKHCGITVISPIDFLQLGTENG